MEAFAAVGRLLWNASWVSRFGFFAGMVLVGWLVVRCGGTEKQAPPDAGPHIVTYDEFSRAREQSAIETSECVRAICSGFDREAIHGLEPSKPPAPHPPTSAGELADARSFEVPVRQDGDVAACEPQFGLAVHELQDRRLWRDDDDRDWCGIAANRDAFASWPQAVEHGLALLREPKHPPPIVVFYSRWCDRGIDGPQPITCSVGMTWIEMPSKRIVASAVGVGKSDPRRLRGERRGGDSYVAAMHDAEQQLVSTALSFTP